MADVTETVDVKQTVTNTATNVSTVTAAHYQSTTIHIREAVPEHPPRVGDPHYKYFNQAKARLTKLGKMKCWVGNHECAGDLELHHSLVEYSLQEGVDISKFEELYPEFGLTSDEQFLEFIEGEGNLTVLCQTGDTPVLMADGDQKPISEISIGDEVVGHDLNPHLVTGTGSRYVSEYINIVNGYGATNEHPFLVSGTWRPVVELTDSMFVLEVVGISFEDLEILDSVIGFNSIVGAKRLMTSFPSNERHVTNRANSLFGINQFVNTSTRRFTDGTTSGVFTGDFVRHGELPFTDTTNVDIVSNIPALKARWAAPRQISRKFHSGLVYHIEVSGCNSYIGGGLAVHNCRLHHIGLRGIHLLPYPLWQPQRFWKADTETDAIVMPASGASIGDIESQHQE